MKIEVFVDTNKHANIEWPADVPLPHNGDFVVMLVPSVGSIGFTVVDRHFGIGIDPRDGSPLTIIRIKAKTKRRAKR